MCQASLCLQTCRRLLCRAVRFLTTPQFPEVGVQQHLHPPRELPKSLMASAARVPRWAGSPRLVFQDIRLSAGTLCNISSKTAPLCQMTEVPPASLPLPCASELCVPCSVGTGARQQGYCPSINHLKINISLCCRAIPPPYTNALKNSTPSLLWTEKHSPPPYSVWREGNPLTPHDTLSTRLPVETVPSPAVSQYEREAQRGWVTNTRVQSGSYHVFISPGLKVLSLRLPERRRTPS